MTWPVPGVKPPTAAKLQWGYQRSPTHVHNGIDVPAREGTPVVAAAAGVVTHAAPQWRQGFSGYGGHVVMAVPSSPPEWHLYAHLAAVDVAPGHRVQAGQRIGTVGRTGGTAADPTALLGSGAHLHFERSPRAYPQASALPRLDPRPVVQMRSLADLSELFVNLRAAVVDRGGKVRPGIALELAARALELVEAFRLWADKSAPGYAPWDKPDVLRDEQYQAWEAKYEAMRKALGYSAATLPEVNPNDPIGIGPAIERVLGGAAVGLLAIGGLYLLLTSRRG